MMTPELKARFDEAVRNNKIVLFMKGNAMFPQCGFSARALQILQQHGQVHQVAPVRRVGEVRDAGVLAA